jgi:mannose-6-phosphate isomerase-like protein (cupin superfamily)
VTTPDAISPDATLQTAALKVNADYIAPDGSEIRLLPTVKGGGLAHCTLPPGRTSLAVRHQKVEEIWYILEGAGEVWRKIGTQEKTVRVQSGDSLTIPLQCHFQFRSAGPPLRFIIATIPQWPGPHEARRVADYWK